MRIKSAIKPVIHERVHYWDIINRIVPIPRRPERTKENQRNKLPKLYAKTKTKRKSKTNYCVRIDIHTYKPSCPRRHM